MRLNRKLLALAGLVVVSAAFMTAGRAVPADRHLRLLKSAPADGDTLSVAPTTLELWFSEAPEVKVTTIQLTGPAGTRKLTKITADAEDANHVIIAMDPPPSSAAGTYSVAWRTMSKDGHVVNGDIAFALRPAR